MTIRHWPQAERPREKLISQGPAALSDAELLAILLRTGHKGKTAIDLSRDLLAYAGGLRQLMQTDLAALANCKGLGQAKATVIGAVAEITRRLAKQMLPPKLMLSSSDATKQFLQLQLRDHDKEIFACLFLDTRNQLIAFEKLFIGTLERADVYPREIVKQAFKHNAKKIIFAHNHPSGDATPSSADIVLTKKLKHTLRALEILVIDHIIVGHDQCISLLECGML